MSSEVSAEKLTDAYSVLRKVRKNPSDGSSLILSYLNQIFKEQGLVFKDASFDTESKTALNSLNGRCMLLDGTCLFYKFHTEENEITFLSKTEIYNVQTLKDAGWEMVTPYASSTKPGAQCVLYPLIKDKTLYSIFNELDGEYLREGSYQPDRKKNLLQSIGDSLDTTRDNLLRTLQPNDRSLSDALIHQLFSHRLISLEGETPRIESFYEKESRYDDVADLRWIVNGKEIPWTLSKLVHDSKKYLAASFSEGMTSVIAHGDEHFANQFIINNKIIFFDPAFAGRMPALLAPVKATAHNVIAHPFWYYEPSEIREKLTYTHTIEKGVVSLTHNWELMKVAPIRVEIAQLYVHKIWKPLIQTLKAANQLPSWWREYIRSAIFCSPFLAKNLLNPVEFTGSQYLFNFGRLLESCRWIEEYISSECS